MTENNGTTPASLTMIIRKTKPGFWMDHLTSSSSLSSSSSSLSSSSHEDVSNYDEEESLGSNSVSWYADLSFCIVPGKSVDRNSERKEPVGFQDSFQHFMDGSEFLLDSDEFDAYYDEDSTEAAICNEITRAATSNNCATAINGSYYRSFDYDDPSSNRKIDQDRNTKDICANSHNVSTPALGRTRSYVLVQEKYCKLKYADLSRSKRQEEDKMIQNFMLVLQDIADGSGRNVGCDDGAREPIKAALDRGTRNDRRLSKVRRDDKQLQTTTARRRRYRKDENKDMVKNISSSPNWYIDGSEPSTMTISRTCTDSTSLEAPERNETFSDDDFISIECLYARR